MIMAGALRGARLSSRANEAGPHADKTRDLPGQLAGLSAGAAAAGGYRRVLHLAGGRSALPVRPPGGRLRPVHDLRRPRQLQGALATILPTSTPSASPSSSRRPRRSWRWASRSSSRPWRIMSSAARAATRRCSIMPYAVAPALAGVLWWFLFNPSIGVLAYVLHADGNSLEPSGQRHRRADPDHHRRPPGSRSPTISSSSSPGCRRSRAR